MAIVTIAQSLRKEIDKKFKKESLKVIDLLLTLRDSPRKGKIVGAVGGIVIKELKYKNYRFYFITDGYKVKFMKAEKLKDLLIKFVRMSDKDTQQEVIDEIKIILRSLGSEGF